MLLGGNLCHGVPQAALGGGRVSRTQGRPRPEWRGRGLPPYLVAIGAGAAVPLHGVLAARPVVLAWPGKAGVALGHDVDVHWSWTAKTQCWWQVPKWAHCHTSLPLCPGPFLSQLLVPPHFHAKRTDSWPSPARTSSPARVPLILPLSNEDKITVGHHSEALLQSNQLL